MHFGPYPKLVTVGEGRSEDQSHACIRDQNKYSICFTRGGRTPDVDAAAGNRLFTAK